MSEIRGESASELPGWIATTFDAHGAPKRPALPPHARADRSVRVLLVDDSHADLVRFGRALSRAGYEVHAEEDGSRAWVRLQEQIFDVVVSDRQMPGTDGIELVRLVRANHELAALPVIMVSGMDTAKDREFGLAAGANEYICKNDVAATPELLDSVERLTREIDVVVPASPLFERALVVDRSRVARQLFARNLRPYCGAIVAVGSVAEARERIDEGFALVVLDATIQGSLPWFEERCALDSRPAFLIVTSRPSQDEETRVSLLGAVAYLAKPIAMRQLSHALVSAAGNFSAAPARAHALPLAEVSIADPSSGEPQLSCHVINLSADGALLATMGPVEVGTRLWLCLGLEGRLIPIRARVVRVQEPGWGVVGGCGVVFEYATGDSRRAVERFVAARSDFRLQPRFGRRETISPLR